MVYPNPAENQLNIMARGLQRIAVYNAMGQLVETKEMTGDQCVLSVGNYRVGLYTLQIVTSNGVVTRSIVVR